VRHPTEGGDATMGYIRDLERELREMLSELAPEKADSVVKFVKEKVYDSYQNGRNGKRDEAKAEAATA
jgi:hypothetical protein